MIKRILGAGLGWTFGGPIGAIAGWWIAGRFDQKEQDQIHRHSHHSGFDGQQTTPNDFIITMLIMASCVMKADQQIKKQEVNFVKQFFLRHFEAETVQEMMSFLREIQDKEYSLVAVAEQINSEMNQEEKIQLIHFLFGISWADGEAHPSETKLIERIARLISLPLSIYNSIKYSYAQGDGKNNNQNNDYGFANNSDNLSHSLRILDLKDSATLEEIKTKYRELSLKHHPDKVAHLGEEVRKAAEEKFKIISEAYQKIIKVKNA